MAINDFSGLDDDLSYPARKAYVVTPHDTNELPTITKGLYVGGAGNITLRLVGDSADVLISAIPAGTILPVRAQYVRSTGTTPALAAVIVALC